MVNANSSTKSHSTKFIKGVLLISIGGLLAKILGALYRIPLTNILGSYGMGLYQLVFPPYILFLTLCQAGVPTALSRLIAQHQQLGEESKAKQVFAKSFCLLLTFGIIGALLMASLSGTIARLEGNMDTVRYFVMIAPAIAFVPVTNVFKGYFQGNMNMLPSSATTVIEQVVKLTVGLTVANYYMPDVGMAVSGAVLAITVSEFVSLFIMSIVYIVHRRKNKVQLPPIVKARDSGVTKQIFSLALPVALGGFVMQLSQVIDSVMVVNLLNVIDPTSLYGLWTGPVNSMLGLPIALSAGVAVSSLPSITRTFVSGNTVQLNKHYNSAMKLTMVIALPCAFGMIALSKNIISLLYSSITPTEIDISSMLLAISAISIAFLAILLTGVSILQAVGKPYVCVVVLSVAIVVKAVANLILLPMKDINIYGAAISESLCYLFACVLVLIYLSRYMKLQLDISGVLIKPFGASLIMLVALTIMVVYGYNFLSTKIGTLIGIVVGGLIYVIGIIVFKVFDTDELSMITSK